MGVSLRSAVAIFALFAAAAIPASADITFASPFYMSVGERPYHLTAGRLNDDAADDIVVCNRSSNTISIILTDGQGGLLPAFSPAQGTRPTPTWVTIADVTNDGLPDILITNQDTHGIQIYRQTRVGGAISFELQGPVWPNGEIYYETTAYPSSIAVTDLNKDGLLDIVVGCYVGHGRQGFIDIFFQAPNGVFPYTPPYTPEAGLTPSHVYLGNYNNDEYSDVFIAHWWGDDVTVFTGGPTPSGLNPGPVKSQYIAYPAPAEITGLAIGNLQRHKDEPPGRDDFVALSDSVYNLVTVFFSEGTGDFRLNTSLNGISGINTSAIADFDGDGWNDVLAVGGGIDLGGELILLTNRGRTGGVHQGFTRGAIPPPGGITGFNAVGDFNGDGKPDFAVNMEDQPRIAVYLNGTSTGVGDTTPPEFFFVAPGTEWHANDVVVSVSAFDSESGLADPADASFTLTTSVPAGTETADASTDSRVVADMAGNHATIGPFTGLKVDKKAPSITLDVPLSTVYTIGSVALAAFSATDGGSGIAGVGGTVARGTAIDTATVGSKSFTVTATDQVGNQSSFSSTYEVAFGQSVLFDQTKAHKSGSNVPIKLQLVDAGGANLSSASITLHTTGIYQVSSAAGGVVEELYTASDFDFTYDPTVGGTGGYRYNLKTNGYPSGTFRVHFTATGDTTTHYVEFRVK